MFFFPMENYSSSFPSFRLEIVVKDYRKIILIKSIKFYDLISIILKREFHSLSLALLVDEN
jgi:hypothetical protein